MQSIFGKRVNEATISAKKNDAVRESVAARIDVNVGYLNESARREKKRETRKVAIEYIVATCTSESSHVAER